MGRKARDSQVGRMNMCLSIRILVNRDGEMGVDEVVQPDWVLVLARMIVRMMNMEQEEADN